MSSIWWLLRNSFLALRRDARYSLLAIIAIAFSSLSVLTMSVLAKSIQAVVVVDQVPYLGGELQIDKESPLTDADVANVEMLKQKGDFGDYTPVIDLKLSLLRHGDLFSPLNYMTGIETKSYPAYGDLTLASGKELKQITLRNYEALVTSDVAYKLGLKVGDEFQMVNEQIGAPITLKLVDIVTDTPHKGGVRVFVSSATAKLLNGSDTYTRILATDIKSDREQLRQEIKDLGLIASFNNLQSYQQPEMIRELFGFAINGVGIIALLVSGIGIINTTRVLMRKRLNEIAVLKTLGYRRDVINLIYLVELTIIAAIGAVVGGLLGMGISDYLIELFKKIGSVLIQNLFTPDIFAKAVIVAMVGTVGFGLFEVSVATKRLPMEIFRKQTLSRIKRFKNLILFVPTIAILVLAAGIALENFLAGAVAIAVCALLMLVLNLILRLVLFIISRIYIPLPRSLSLGKLNLQRNIGKFTFSFLALLIGTVTISLVVTVNESISQRSTPTAQVTSNVTFNVITYSSIENAATLIKKYQEKSSDFSYAYSTTFHWENILTLDVSGLKELLGRPKFNPGFGLEFEGEPFGTVENGVYLPVLYNAEKYEFTRGGGSYQENPVAKKIGDKISAVTNSGIKEFVVAGYYTYTSGGNSIGSYPDGYIIDEERYKKIVTDEKSSFTVMGKVGDAKAFADELNSALSSSSFSIDKETYDKLTIGILQNFANFAVGLASLSFIAAVTLIVNVVGLSMLERRREIAILKSVGYSLNQIRAIILVEFGFISILVAILTIISITVLVDLINKAEPSAQLQVSWSGMLIVVCFSIILTFVTVLIASWQDLRIKPLAIMRED